MPRLFLLLAVVPFAGCKGPGGGCEPSQSPTVSVGVGETAYEPHQDGDAARLIAGPQGGYHITLAVEATGFDIDEDLVGDFNGTVAGALVGQSDPFVFLRCNNQTSTQQAWDLRLVYDDIPANLDGQTTEVTMTLQDSTGRSASGTTTFVIDASSI